MPSSIGHCSVHSVSGLLDVTRVTMRPMKAGMVESSTRDDEARHEQRREQALGLAREVPIERDRPAGGCDCAGGSVGLRAVFEQAEHGEGMHLSMVLGQMVAAARAEII